MPNAIGIHPAYFHIVLRLVLPEAQVVLHPANPLARSYLALSFDQCEATGMHRCARLLAVGLYFLMVPLDRHDER